MSGEAVRLYRAPTSACDVDEIGEWLEERLDVSVEVRGRFLDRFRDDDLPTDFAQARVHAPFERETGSSMYGIIQYERRLLDHPERGGGVLYDGLALQRACNRLLPDDERDLETPHIIALDRHIATWGDHDGRWHKRIAVLGQPSLFSIPGLAEAPAKPEAYYQLKQRHALVSGDAPPREVLESAIDEDVIVPDDSRTSDGFKGYALAAVHFLRTGEAFCTEPECRLYNGHRHGEVIRAQCEPPELCPTHRSMYGR